MELNKVENKLSELATEVGDAIEGGVKEVEHLAKEAVGMTEDSPRKIAGLVSGRIVNFVMRNAAIRPFIVVNAGDGAGSINGVLLFDGSNDDGIVPDHVKVRDNYLSPECSAWVPGVPYSDELVPFSWHWPGSRHATSGPAVINPEQLRTLLELELPKVIAFTDVANLINDKLAAHTEMVNRLLDSQADLFNQAIEAAKAQFAQTTEGKDQELQKIADAGNAANVAVTTTPVNTPPPPAEGVKFVENPIEVVSNTVGEASQVVELGGVSIEQESVVSKSGIDKDSSEL